MTFGTKILKNRLYHVNQHEKYYKLCFDNFSLRRLFCEESPTPLKYKSTKPQQPQEKEREGGVMYGYNKISSVGSRTRAICMGDSYPDHKTMKVHCKSRKNNQHLNFCPFSNFYFKIRQIWYYGKNCLYLSWHN